MFFVTIQCIWLSQINLFDLIDVVGLIVLQLGLDTHSPQLICRDEMATSDIRSFFLVSFLPCPK